MYLKHSFFVQLLRVLLAFSLSPILIACATATPTTLATPSGNGTPASQENPETTPSTSVEDENVVITYAISRWEKSLYEPLVEEFNAQNPGITVQLVETDDLWQGTDASTQSYMRLLASAADVSMIWISYEEGANNFFRDLQPLMDADATFEPDDFWPGLMLGCQDLEGRALGVPIYGGVNGIFFNKQAFDEAGLPYPQPGWTYEDFQRTVQALAHKDGAEIRYGYADRESLFSSIMAPLVDARLLELNGELDATALQETLQWYIDLAKADVIYPVRMTDENDWEANWQKWEAMFQSENRPAMWAGGLTESLPGSTMAWDENDPLSGMALKTEGFAPFPVSESEHILNTSPAYVACLGISAGSAHPRAAWAWVSFLSHHWLVQDQDQGWALSQAPARQSVADAVGYWDRLPDSARRAVQFAMEHSWTISPYIMQFMTVNSALSEALAGKAEFAAALNEAQADLEATPQPTPDTTPVVVATPKPTPNIAAGATIVKYLTSITDLEDEKKIEALIEAYQRQYPDIHIELSTDWDLGGEQIDDWNVYIAENFDCYSWYPPYWPQEKPDHLLGLSALIQAEGAEFTNDFYPEQLDVYRYEGEVYGLPAVSDPQIMGYNADLLAERGLEPPSTDWTLDDFIPLASAAAGSSENGNTYGFLFSEYDDLFFTGRGVAWADLKSDPPVAKFDTPEMVETLTWLVEMKNSGAFLVQGDDNWEETATAVSEGRVAFWMAQASQPEGWYSMTGEPPAYKVGVALVPQAVGTGEIQTYAMERGFFISKQSENVQACWNWIKFLSEQPNLSIGIPARKSVTESPEWETFVGAENAEMYRQAAAHINRDVFYSDSSPISWPFFTWRAQAIHAALAGEDPQKALTAAQLKADDYLACMLGVDIDKLTGEQINDQANTCAQQADPEGPWGGGGGGGG